MIESLRDLSAELIEMNPNIPTEAAEAIKGIDRLGFLVNFIGSNMQVEVEDKQVILEEVDRLDGFVGRVLDLSRAVTPQPEVVALGALVTRAAAVAEVQVEAPTGAVYADPDLLIAVLAGLLLNARQHGASRIAVTSGAAEAGAWIAVEDDGAGIAEAVSETLFEPFVTTRPQGTGLGLAMGRRILAAHGGTLERMPSALGGAGFRLFLPGRMG